MYTSFEEWCEENDDIAILAKGLKSSIPEQYVGFYLSKGFGEEIEYAKQFSWMGNYSLDFYIPSISLGIEYDGIRFHDDRRSDIVKSKLCKENGVSLVRIIEKGVSVHNENDIVIEYNKKNKYVNIGEPIAQLSETMKDLFGNEFLVDVDIKRDEKAIISYIQNKYYRRTIAYYWPESIERWAEENGDWTPFDVFYTDTHSYLLRCPKCKGKYEMHMRYLHGFSRKAIIPCHCEYKELDDELQRIIMDYVDYGRLPVLNNTFESRRIYDKMQHSIHWGYFKCKEEIEMYRKIGIKGRFMEMNSKQCGF